MWFCFHSLLTQNKLAAFKIDFIIFQIIEKRYLSTLRTNENPDDYTEIEEKLDKQWSTG